MPWEYLNIIYWPTIRTNNLTGYTHTHSEQSSLLHYANARKLFSQFGNCQCFFKSFSYNSSPWRKHTHTGNSYTCVYAYLYNLIVFCRIFEGPAGIGNSQFVVWCSLVCVWAMGMAVFSRALLLLQVAVVDKNRLTLHFRDQAILSWKICKILRKIRTAFLDLRNETCGPRKNEEKKLACRARSIRLPSLKQSN